MSDADLFWQALTLHSAARVKDVKDNNLSFAHYTSADAAMHIINSKIIRLRNFHVMNDYSEVSYGNALVDYVWNDTDVGSDLKKFLDDSFPEISGEIFTKYLEMAGARNSSTFMTALTEHDTSHHEGRYGRLSMWRAYGGDTNVALIFKSGMILEDNSTEHLNISPVLYADKDMFLSKFADVVSVVLNSGALIKTAPRTEACRLFATALHYAAVSTKHPGFSEEREWRVLYCPGVVGRGSLPTDIITVGGIPQRIALLNLETVFSNNGGGFLDFLHEIIIGPTAYPWPLWDALVEVLTKNGFKNASQMVKISNTPLRR